MLQYDNNLPPVEFYLTPEERAELSWKLQKENKRMIQFHGKTVEQPFPPISIEDAENQILALLVDINEIEAQLGDRDKKDSTGSRLWGEDYWSWRTKANSARVAKINHRAKLKKWIKDQRQNVRENMAEEAKSSGLQGLIVATTDLLHKLASEGVEFTDQEQGLIDALTEYAFVEG